MDAHELEATLLKLFHDADATDIEGGFKGHLILSTNGTKVFATPKTILRAAQNSGRPSTHSGLAFVVTHEDNSPLTDYQGMADLTATAKPIGVRELTYGEFIDKFGSLFAYNEVDFDEIEDPFASMLARLP